ncbi:hypothetical protein PV327_000183 [Microctonus hyperodae]|uniref:Uncharacterized protein n=1 Tax=Microctonus hyperodae TaxID=165561 RepID=A0AA39G5N7_MICHY|nr:hypothetical protein PV327_000183 [Microctonus hyperodae]
MFLGIKNEYKYAMTSKNCTEQCPQKRVVKQVATKLLRALSEKGLALLVNHGVPDYKMKAVYRALNAFCELPKESRAKFECSKPSGHGYIKPETEQYTTDETKTRHEYIVSGNNTALPDEDVPNFRSAVEELTSDFKQLSAMLLTALAVALGQQSEFFLNQHKSLLDVGNESSFRMIYYPPYAMPESDFIRCGASCDSGTFTLLAQDCENGLEIQMPHSERWERVGHLPGAILVHTGDCLGKWTNQQIPSLKHRVVMPEHCGRGRHSIGFCVQPDKDVHIEPLDMKIIIPSQEPVICRLQKKKRGVLNAYYHLQRRFRET